MKKVQASQCHWELETEMKGETNVGMGDKEEYNESKTILTITSYQWEPVLDTNTPLPPKERAEVSIMPKYFLCFLLLCSV